MLSSSFEVRMLVFFTWTAECQYLLAQYSPGLVYSRVSFAFLILRIHPYRTFQPALLFPFTPDPDDLCLFYPFAFLCFYCVDSPVDSVLLAPIASCLTNYSSLPGCVNRRLTWCLAPPFSTAVWMSALLTAHPPPLFPRPIPTSLSWLTSSKMRWRILMMRHSWMTPALTQGRRRDQISSVTGMTRFTTDPLGSF